MESTLIVVVLQTGSFIVQSLIATGFHPEQINHSITALFINCKQHFSDSQWDEDTRRYVQRIIVEIAKHNADYSNKQNRMNNDQFVQLLLILLAFISLVVVIKRLKENIVLHVINSMIFLSLYHQMNAVCLDKSVLNGQNNEQIYQGHSTWILQKKNAKSAAYYIHSTDVIPPRFNWVCPVAENYPGMK